MSWPMLLCVFSCYITAINAFPITYLTKTSQEFPPNEKKSLFPKQHSREPGNTLYVSMKDDKSFDHLPGPYDPIDPTREYTEEELDYMERKSLPIIEQMEKELAKRLREKKKNSILKNLLPGHSLKPKGPYWRSENSQDGRKPSTYKPISFNYVIGRDNGKDVKSAQAGANLGDC